MNTIFSANWIKAPESLGADVVYFKKDLSLNKKIARATLNITARGVYEVFVDGNRVGDFILAPGNTNYFVRHQYQQYDVTDLVKADSSLTVSAGSGWCSGRISWYSRCLLRRKDDPSYSNPIALIAALDIEYDDGTNECIVTDESWSVSKWSVMSSDLYDGEVFDSNVECDFMPAELFDFPTDALIPTEGEKIIEHETLKPAREIITPKGERVIDFGQEITGYVAFDVTAKMGDRIVIDHGEVLDSDGNFYRDNLRSAKAQITYICKNGKQSYKPHHTFMGFRYIRLTECPTDIPTESFSAVVVHSDIKRVGYFTCSNEKVNKLYSNLVWGQRDNFLDIPTDCPQRDEKLGWTGDAQVFVKTASYNYDVQKFFRKWLRDLKSEQAANGAIPRVIPNVLDNKDKYGIGKVECASAWADAVTICPWQMFLSYADRDILEEMLPAMEKYIAYIKADGDDPYRWATGGVFGDWLSMEPTDKQFIADAFYAYSTSLVIKTMHALGRDASEYEKLYEKVVESFRKNYREYNSQTECVLALRFDLTEDKPATAAKLVQMIHNNDDRLSTGFVGTPYLMHVLSENGYADVAYTLLLQEKFPSWLFSVNMGATTIWEHWDSQREDGSFWSTEMNSFNHYAYGSVGDWMYGVVCGIKPREDAPGYEEFDFAPIADSRLEYAEMEYETRFGKIKAGWHRAGDGFIYNLTVPEGTRAHVKLGDTEKILTAGEYEF